MVNKKTKDILDDKQWYENYINREYDKNKSNFDKVLASVPCTLQKNIRYSSNVEKTVGLLTYKSLDDAQSIKVLCDNRQYIGAGALARVITESAIRVKQIYDSPKHADQYEEFKPIGQLNLLRLHNETGFSVPSDKLEVSPETLSKKKKEWIKKYKSRSKNPNSWATQSIYSEKNEKLNPLVIHYNYFCNFIHSSISLESCFNDEKDNIIISRDNKTIGLLSLIAATDSLLIIIFYFKKVFNVSGDDIINRQISNMMQRYPLEKQ